DESSDSCAQASKQNQKNGCYHNRLFPANGFALTSCEKVNGWRQAKICAHAKQVETDQHRDGCSITPSPDHEGEASQGIPRSIYPAHPMDADPDKVILQPENEDEDSREEKVLDIAGSDTVSKREALNAKCQDG